MIFTWCFHEKTAYSYILNVPLMFVKKQRCTSGVVLGGLYRVRLLYNIMVLYSRCLGWLDRRNVLEEIFDWLKGYMGGFIFSAMICYSSEDGFIPGTFAWINVLFFYFGAFCLSNHLIVDVYRNMYIFKIVYVLKFCTMLYIFKDSKCFHSYKITRCFMCRCETILRTRG